MKINKKNVFLKTIDAIILLSIIIGTSVWYFMYYEPVDTDETKIPVVVSLEKKQNYKVVSKDYITYTASPKGSAIDQLAAMNKTVFVKNTESGTSVYILNGLTNGKDGKFWNLFIDGKLVGVPPDKDKLKGGESIEWKYQKKQ